MRTVSSRIRVLVAHNVSRVRNGGMSRLMGFVHDQLAEQGVDVSYFCSEDVLSSLSPALRELAFPFLAFKKAVVAARKGHQYHIVNVHEPAGSMLAVFRRATAYPKVVVTSYGVEKRRWELKIQESRLSGNPLKLRTRIIHPLVRVSQATLALKKADHVLCASMDDERFLRHRLKISEGKITHLVPGAKPVYAEAANRLPRRDEESRLLFAASWIDRKGTTELVKAFVSLAAAHPGLTLTVLGPGAPKEVILRDFPDDLRSRVFVANSTNETENAEVFAKASVFVLPSIFEGTPLTLIEAMMAALPIVTTATCGMKDIIRDGVNGILIPPRSSSALFEAVDLLLRNKALAVKIGSLAQTEALSQYTWERATSSVMSVYRQLSCAQVDDEGP
jgi:glycosyltransferase involved in cell wall biosynthesis